MDKIFFFILCVFISFVKSNDKNIISVRLKNGLINGKIETTIDSKKLSVFRGIPYAVPPINDLRFRKPLPIGEWEDPIDAFELSKVCPQNLIMLQNLGSNLQMSEDCLHLNIWSPNGNENNDILKPVMFWIHGGALQLGSASEMQYNGQVLAAKGDVVVVSINYRLNAFGFLYSGTDEAPGNVGLWDQALALEWVKDNIKYFGGDPDQITIFGESAGSWSVSLHVLSPITRNMFKNAIMHSGAYIYNFIDDTPEDHIQKWTKGARLIGCSDDQADNKLTAKIIDCLRKVDLEKLVSIESLPEMNENAFKFFTNIVIDGTFLPKMPIEMLRSKDYNKNLNLLFNTNGDEGSFMLPFGVDFKKYHPFTPQNQTLSESYNDLIHLSEDLRSNKTINGREVAKMYFMGLSDNDNYDLFRRTIGIAIGDYYLSCPAIIFAKEFFRNSDYKNSVYQYFFNYKSNIESPICSKWMGVCHGNDVIPTFGLPFIVPELEFTEKDKEVSAQMIQFLTDFAKTGVPTAQNDSEWPKFFNIGDKIIAPYYEIKEEPNSGYNFEIGLKISECEYLWKKHLT